MARLSDETTAIDARARLEGARDALRAAYRDKAVVVHDPGVLDMEANSVDVAYLEKRIARLRNHLDDEVREWGRFALRCYGMEDLLEAEAALANFKDRLNAKGEDE